MLSACTTISKDDARIRSFSISPNGERSEARETRPQRGHRAMPEITADSFREVTIAQGSGLDGFETIRVFSDRSGYVIVRLSGTRAARVPFRLSSQQFTHLISALQQDEIHRISGMYSAGIADGTQGFIEVVTSNGRVYSWLDNYFFPVAHTYTFCNEQIWPHVPKMLPSDRGGDYDFQEEYDRVFKD